MTVITRFAPSPTGILHIGNIRTAIICYMFAKSKKGKFMLRIDDTDKERSKKEYTDFIKKDLEWLGLKWDIESFQSLRISRYNEIKKLLIEKDLLYDCYETAEEIEMKRKLLLSLGKPPIYNREDALKLTEKEKENLRKEGREPYWRFKLTDNKIIKWKDQIKGDISFNTKDLNDPVLIRADQTMTYMLPSTIDDIDFSITDIIRGEDHISNTAIQINIFESLNSQIPNFAHHSLIKSNEGKISKREGGFDIQSLKLKNIEPIAIKNFLVDTGEKNTTKKYINDEEILENFDLEKLGKTSFIYSFEKLKKINSKIVHDMEYEKAKNYKSIEKVDKEFWELVQKNISTVSEAEEWRKICKEKIQPIINKEDILYIETASSLLENYIWDEFVWDTWIKDIEKNTDRKGKNLFMPLRKALTGREDGPNLEKILLILGKVKTQARLKGKIA